MQHTIYLLKNGLVVQLDWHCCITVGAVIFLFVHIFPYLYLHYIIFTFMLNLQYILGKGPR